MREMVHPRLNGAAAMSFSLLSLSLIAVLSPSPLDISQALLAHCALATRQQGLSNAMANPVRALPWSPRPEAVRGSSFWLFSAPPKRDWPMCVFFCILPKASSGNWRKKRRSWRTKARRCSPSGNGSECGQACESKRGRTQAAEGQWWWRYAFGIVCLFPAFAASSSSSSLFVLQQNHFHNSCLTFYVCGSMHAQRSRTWPPPSRQQ